MLNMLKTIFVIDNEKYTSLMLFGWTILYWMSYCLAVTSHIYNKCLYQSYDGLKIIIAPAQYEELAHPMSRFHESQSHYMYIN